MRRTGEQDELCVEIGTKLRVNRSWVRIWRDAEPSVCRGGVPLPCLPGCAWSVVSRMLEGWQVVTVNEVQWILVHPQSAFQDPVCICLTPPSIPPLPSVKSEWWPCVCGAENLGDFSVCFPFPLLFSFLFILCQCLLWVFQLTLKSPCSQGWPWTLASCLYLLSARIIVMCHHT